MKNRFYQESHTKTCQEIEELRRICCEETNRVRQLRIDELSLQQEWDPTTVSQLLSQILDSHNKANSLSEERDFHDPETASSSGASNVPCQPLTIPSTRSMHCRDLDCRQIHGIPMLLNETCFKACLLQKYHPPCFSKNRETWHLLLAD